MFCDFCFKSIRSRKRFIDDYLILCEYCFHVRHDVHEEWKTYFIAMMFFPFVAFTISGSIIAETILGKFLYIMGTISLLIYLANFQAKKTFPRICPNDAEHAG